MKKKKILSLILTGVCCLSILAGSSFAVMADENKTGQEKRRTLDMAGAGQIALKNNPSIKAVKERLAQAEAVVKQAKAAFYPSLDAAGTVSMTDYSDASALPDIDEEYSAELSATLVLFSGFSRKLALDLAASSNSSEIEAWNNAKRLLLLSVAQSYTNVQLATAAIETWETDTHYYEKLLKDAEIKHKAGSGSLSDVLSFKVQVNASESDLTDAQKNYRIALAGFAAILGYEDLKLPEGTALTSLGSDLYNKTSLPDISALTELAELNRPDLKQYGFAITQAEKNIGISQSGYYPTVSLYGTYNGQRNDDAGFDSEDFGSTAGVKVSFNIFSGGLTKSKVAEARAKKREATFNKSEKVTSVKEEVLTAYYELDNAIKQLDLQKASTTLVKRNRDLIEAEYRAGKTSLVRLTEAQSNVIKTRNLYYQAAANLKFAEEKIKAYTGTNLNR